MIDILIGCTKSSLDYGLWWDGVVWWYSGLYTYAGGVVDHPIWSRAISHPLRSSGHEHGRGQQGCVCIYSVLARSRYLSRPYSFFNSTTIIFICRSMFVANVRRLRCMYINPPELEPFFVPPPSPQLQPRSPLFRFAFLCFRLLAPAPVCPC